MKIRLIFLLLMTFLLVSCQLTSSLFTGSRSTVTPLPTHPTPASPTALPNGPLTSPTAATRTTLPPAALTATTAPSPTPVTPPPQNIILVIVDTLRSDHVSSNGYSRNTTPYLDALVGGAGVRFVNVTSTAPWTCPSVAAMMTGRTPTSLNSTFKTMGKALPNSAETLAEILSKTGYYTAGFASTYCTKGRLGFSQGFDHYDDYLTDRPGSNKARADEVNGRAIEWLESKWLPRQAGKSPLFLMLYYFDPHPWYTPPPPYDTLYDSTYTGTLTAEVYGWSRDVVEGKITPTQRDVEHLIALYDGEITYWDSQLGQMLIYLEEHHLMDNTLLIVTSDHGEMFGEHGKWAHTGSLYQEVLRIPLFMRYSGVIPAGSVISSPVQNFDLMPTILDWVGVPQPEDVQALSLLSLSLGQEGDTTRPLISEVDAVTDPNFSLYWSAPRVSLRSIQQSDWKLIHHLEIPTDDELYELNPASLYEADNLYPSEPARAQELLQLLFTSFGLTP